MKILICIFFLTFFSGFRDISGFYIETENDTNINKIDNSDSEKVDSNDKMSNVSLAPNSEF